MRAYRVLAPRNLAPKPRGRKRCSACSVSKDCSAFQRRAASRDGLTAACRECLSTRDKGRDTPKRAAARLHYQATKGKVAHARALVRWQKDNPEKHMAHYTLTNAVRDGRIVKPPRCQKCRAPTPSKKLHGHHADYRKPLVVLWLCEGCHTLEHHHVAQAA